MVGINRIFKVIRIFILSLVLRLISLAITVKSLYAYICQSLFIQIIINTLRFSLTLYQIFITCTQASQTTLSFNNFRRSEEHVLLIFSTYDKLYTLYAAQQRLNKYTQVACGPDCFPIQRT